jgi:tRNA (cytidine/uridine-2'-O-)-methyltransferase
MDDKKLRRAGLDYKELSRVYEYENLNDYLSIAKPKRLFTVSSKVTTLYSDIKYEAEDSFIFGPETRGLPLNIINQYQSITIPMQKGSRSLNLANSVSVVIYEAWRQIEFMGAKNLE